MRKHLVANDGNVIPATAGPAFTAALMEHHRSKFVRSVEGLVQMDRLSFVAHFRWVRGWAKRDAERKWDTIEALYC